MEKVLSSAELAIKQAEEKVERAKLDAEFIRDLMHGDFEKTQPTYVHRTGYKCDGSVKYEKGTYARAVELMRQYPPLPAVYVKAGSLSLIPREKHTDAEEEKAEQSFSIAGFSIECERGKGYGGERVKWWSRVSCATRSYVIQFCVEMEKPRFPIGIERERVKTSHGDDGKGLRKWVEPDCKLSGRNIIRWWGEEPKYAGDTMFEGHKRYTFYFDEGTPIETLTEEVQP
jgi:hypothetical protein